MISESKEKNFNLAVGEKYIQEHDKKKTNGRI